jgi:glycosyltransferase involved in cell wall biosynthesis
VNILAYVHLRNIWRSTGVGRLARSMVEKLVEARQDRVVVLADPRDHREVIPQVGEPWSGYEYRFLKRETSQQQALWSLFDRPNAESFWPEADVVYCPAESYVPVRRARLAVTVHDAAFFEVVAHRRNIGTTKQRLKWKFLFRKLSKHADRLFTVSQFSAERLAHFFPALRDRLRVVPSAVPDRFFLPVSSEGEQALAALGLAGRRFVLLPGGLHFRKNADLVLECWPRILSKNPELRLVVTGHCDASYGERARRLGPTIEFAGFVDDEVLCSIYHAASLVWFPSRYEGFGLPPLESMACGTPVVSSSSSSIPEVTGGAALLVSPSSSDAHVEAVDAVLNDSALADRLVAAGRPRARMFTWQNAGDKLRTQLQELA